MLGELHAKYGQYSKAIPYYENTVQLDGTKPVYYIRLGGMYIFEKDFDAAFRTFTSASRKFPDIPEIHYFLAITARAKNDPDTAIDEVKRSLALKETADSNALLGAILSDRNELTDAEKYLRKAISIDPDHFNANRDLGRMLARQAKFTAALPFLQRASTIRPSDPDLHYQLFLAYSRLKLKPEADRELAIFKELSGKK
jgi:tetratricopeptide (TPR) repeat protein